LIGHFLSPLLNTESKILIKAVLEALNAGLNCKHYSSLPLRGFWEAIAVIRKVLAGLGSRRRC
jgi:hypothetical protein